MKRIITIIVMIAYAAVLMNSCQTSTPETVIPETKTGVPLTIQASIVPQGETKTIFEYTPAKTLAASWKEEESITVVSFGTNGITAIDKFTSSGEAGRKKAEFSGTWTGNEGDKVICLYPAVDSYAGISIFENVTVYSPTIYMRNLSTPSDPLQNDDTDSVSDVDLMLGEVNISGGTAHVYLKHLFAVFRIEATLQSLPYYGEPYYMATVNSIRISAADPNGNEKVFVRMTGLDVTTESYTGEPYALEKGPQNYYLISAGSYSDFHMMGNDGKNPITKTFYVPVRFEEDLKAGYELHLQFGGYYYEYSSGDLTHTDVFPVGDKRKQITSTLPLENGKVYNIKVSI